MSFCEEHCWLLCVKLGSCFHGYAFFHHFSVHVGRSASDTVGLMMWLLDLVAFCFMAGIPDGK